MVINHLPYLNWADFAPIRSLLASSHKAGRPSWMELAENVQKPRHCRLDKFRIFTLSNDSAAYQSPFTFAGHNSIFSHFQVMLLFCYKVCTISSVRNFVLLKPSKLCTACNPNQDSVSVHLVELVNGHNQRSSYARV